MPVRTLRALAFLLSAVVIFAPNAALAGMPSKADSHLQVFNKSDSCAWVTAYWSYGSEAHWRISDARWVKPHSEARFYETFNHPALGPEWKVRFEVRSKDGGQCRGHGGDPDLSGKAFVHVRTMGDIFTTWIANCNNSATLTGSSKEGYKVFVAPAFPCSRR